MPSITSVFCTAAAVAVACIAIVLYAAPPVSAAPTVKPNDIVRLFEDTSPDSSNNAVEAYVVIKIKRLEAVLALLQQQQPSLTASRPSPSVPTKPRTYPTTRLPQTNGSSGVNGGGDRLGAVDDDNSTEKPRTDKETAKDSRNFITRLANTAQDTAGDAIDSVGVDNLSNVVAGTAGTAVTVAAAPFLGPAAPLVGTAVATGTKQLTNNFATRVANGDEDGDVDSQDS